MRSCFGFLFFILIASASLKAQSYASSGINLVGFIDPESVQGTDLIKYSGCWGYNQVAKGREYALVGSSTGTYFIDITAPATPTVCDYVKGTHPSPCIWREIKVYQHYAYVISDDPSPNSFQIIDLQYLPDSVHVVYDGKTDYFERGHTLAVDGDKLYVGGITLWDGSTVNMRVYSLATPSVPVLLRTLSDNYSYISYVHDMCVRNDTVYASCAYQGLQVFRLDAGNTFTILGSLTSYPESGYNHSSSLTQNGKNLVFCDEVPTNLSIKLADVSSLSNITVTSLFRPNANSGFVGHNPYVIGNGWVFVSCYEDGLYLYDISNPANPVMAGYFDTYPQGGASFGNNYGSSSYNGNWGAFPYFTSGHILACDMQNGVFILEANNLLSPQAGINENEEGSLTVCVYPNPVCGQLMLSVKTAGPCDIILELKTLQGQQVLSEKWADDHSCATMSYQLDVSVLPAGIYLLSVSTGKKTARQKVLICR